MNFNARFFIRVIIVIFILYTFYHEGLSWGYIIILGIIFGLIIFLRGKLYRKIDHLLKKHLKFMSKIKKPWVEKLIIIIVFIIVYIALRELVYFVLSLFGINLQHALININQTGKLS